MGMLKKGGIIKESSSLPDPIPTLNFHPVTIEYRNNNGNVDNFLQTAVAGTGSATEDATNHQMDLAVTGGGVGTAKYRTKDTYSLSAIQIVFTIQVTNIVLTASGTDVNGTVGLMEDAQVDPDGNHGAGFEIGQTANIRCFHNDGQVTATYFDTGSTPVSQLLTMVATSSFIDFYVNAIRVYRATTFLPTNPCNFGVVINTTAALVRSISVMSLKMQKYYV